MSKILIIGATSTIAELCARIWANSGYDLFLVGRNAERLDLIATDLSVRGASKVAQYVLDLNNFDGHQAMLDAAMAELGGIDTVLIAHGTLSDQKACEQSVSLTMQEITTNAMSVVALLTLISNRFEAQHKGNIAVISSVAGDRGRKSNYVYGAAKGLVTRFVEGMQNRYADTGINVMLIKPGPIDTPMTSHLKGKSVKLAHPQVVAKQIVNGIQANTPLIYTPRKWRLIMLVIRHLPLALFNKMNI